MINTGQFSETGDGALERILKEDELKIAHERLLFHLENTPLGFMEWDNQLRVRSLSKRAEEIFGWTKGEFNDNTKNGFIPVFVDDLPLVSKITEQLTSGEVKSNQSQHRNITKNGNVIWCEWFNSILKDKDGKVVTIVSLMQDITEQKKNEERLIYQQNRFRSLIEKGKDMIMLRSAEGNLLYLSPSVTHVLGYSSEEITALNLNNFIHSDDLPGLLEQTQVILKTPGSSFFLQQRCFHKNGTWVWCEGTVTNMLFEPGVNALLTNFRDISERKLSELNRIENQSLIKAIYTASLDAVIIIDADGMIVKWDDKSETLFGWKETEVAGLKLADIIIPERYRERHNNGMRHYSRTGEGPVLGKTIDISALKKSGVEFDVSLSITPSEINGEKHFIGFIRDISEKKIAEQQREFNKNNLYALINNTDDLMWSVDKDFKLITSNQQFSAAIPFRLGSSFVNGANIVVPGFQLGKVDRFKNFYKRALAGETFTEVVHVVTPVESWAEISFYPIRKNEEVIGTACNSRDITARVLAEQEHSKITADLIQRNKDLEQFAYIVSHNLRAPVANILGTANELKDPGVSTGDKEILNKGLHESVVKLDNVVKDLSQILQIKHQITEIGEKVCFSKLVEDVKISIKNLIEKDNVVIKCDFSEIDEFLVLKSYMHSIFYNLISNSIKYRRQHVACVIEIASHRLQNTIELVFSDNGMGIDLQKRGEQVFGLYKRFHPNIEGKGMGLFMVKTQVETLGGKIGIKSEVNKGTEIRIEFDK